ncbi:hypothetical protein O0L34_g16091 [Tuta absoluta]|nr:hypothetical protein O0L34_g16091 [Tuta absoluta]
MFLFYASLVIVILAGASCRTVELEHDLDDENNGQIAHFLLPLLGSNDKSDLNVEVVPYQDYKNTKKSKSNRKPVAAITPLETTKKESPLAVILANAKYTKNKKSKNGTKATKVIDLPFWNSAEEKLHADDFDADTSIIIHVKRKKDNLTKGKKAGHKKHGVKSKDVKKSNSKENYINEHLLMDNDDVSYSEEDSLYHNTKLDKDKLISNKGIKQVKPKHYVKKNENVLNIPVIRKIATAKEESKTKDDSEEKIYITSSKKDKHSTGKAQYEHAPDDYLNNSQEVLEPQMSNEFGIEQDYKINADEDPKSIQIRNEESVATGTTKLNSEERSGSEDSKQSDINDSLPSIQDVKKYKEEHGNNSSSYQMESVIEPESSNEGINENFVDDLSTSFENVKLNHNPLREITQKYDHKDMTNLHNVMDDKSASLEEKEPSDDTINKIYHPNLQFQTEPLSINNSQLNENSKNNSNEVGSISTNKALLKTYKLLFDKDTKDDKYQFEMSKENNIHETYHDQENQSLQKSHSNKIINALSKVKPKVDKQAKNLTNNQNLDVENVPLSKDIEKDISDLQFDKIEYADTPDYEIIPESNTKEKKEDTEHSGKDTSTIDTNLIPSNTHVSSDSDIVLLNSGKVIKYEAPTNIKVVKEIEANHSEVDNIDHQVKANQKYLLPDKPSKKGAVKNIDEILKNVAPADESRDGDSKSNENNIIFSNDKKGIVTVLKGGGNVKKETAALHPGDNTKVLNKEIEAMAAFLKKGNLLRSKPDIGSKSYNLSFLFNRR